MATDYQARKSAKKFRKSERQKDATPKRIRKKKQARRLCRGPCYQLPALTTDDMHDSEVPANPALLYDDDADGLKTAAAKSNSTKKRSKPASNDDEDKTEAVNKKPLTKKPKLSTGINLLKPPTTPPAPVSSAKKKTNKTDVDNNINNEVPLALQKLPPLFQHYMLAEGFTEPTQVQMQCWPALLKGKDLEAVAQPGSGKTLAYALPALQLLVKKGHGKETMPQGPLVLVLLPTRELAQQVNTVFRALTRHSGGCRTICITGGTDKSKQVSWLQEKAPHTVVATPGRLLDLIDDNSLSLDNVSLIVLDEADKMLSMGFAPQIDRIKELLFRSEASHEEEDAAVVKKQSKHSKTTKLPSSKTKSTKPQVALLTATLPKEVQHVVATWLANPTKVHLTGEESTDLSISTTVTQVIQVCAEHKKPAKLLKHLNTIKEASKNQRHQPRILIFANRIKTVRFICNQVAAAGYRCAQLHGERSQQERDEAIQDFKSGKAQILVASDVAARGLHINNLPYVVNYDFPGNLETYVHRVGRTGRLAADGHAYSFMTRELAPVAQPVIELLQQHGQSIDPNLVKLANAYAIAAERLGLKVGGEKSRNKASGAAAKEVNDEEGVEEEDDVVVKPRTDDVLHELGLKSKADKKKKKKRNTNAAEMDDDEAKIGATTLSPVVSDVDDSDDSKDGWEMPSNDADEDAAFSKKKPAIALKAAKLANVKKKAAAAQPQPQEETTTQKPPEFIASKKFAGAKPGYAFKKGHSGIGYYKDVNIYELWKAQQTQKEQNGGAAKKQLKAKYAALPIGGVSSAGDAEGVKKAKNRTSHKQLPGRLRKKLAKEKASVGGD